MGHDDHENQDASKARQTAHLFDIDRHQNMTNESLFDGEMMVTEMWPDQMQ